MLCALVLVNPIPASENTAQTNPEQSYRFGPVAPYKYGIPNFDWMEFNIADVVEVAKRELFAGSIADMGRESAVFFISCCLYSSDTLMSVVKGWRIAGAFVGSEESVVFVLSAVGV